MAQGERYTFETIEEFLSRVVRTPCGKWGDSVAQLSPGCAYLLGSEGHFVIVGTCTSSPITAEQHRAKEPPLHVRRSCFAPAARNPRVPSGGGAGYRPRVRSAYYVAVYRHSRLPGTANITTRALLKKGTPVPRPLVNLSMVSRISAVTGVNRPLVELRDGSRAAKQPFDKPCFDAGARAAPCFTSIAMTRRRS